jgi:hypothetical protein
MTHTVGSPFPRHLNGRYITDEVCQCGHLRSLHDDTVGYGHGSCTMHAGSCQCTKFSWARFVYSEVPT